MLLKKIKIKNFRNFDNQVFSFNPFFTVIVGRNSVGKTNLLEALYFAIKGHGFRDKEEEELIQFGKTTGSVEIELGSEDETILYRVNFQKDKDKLFLKNCFINGIKKRVFDYSNQNIPLVIFSPSFMYVIDGEMGKRRDFIDLIINKIDAEYKKRLSNYSNALKKRNKILEKTKDIKNLKEELLFWDDYLIQQADYLTLKRQNLVDFLNNHQKLNDRQFKIKYLKNEISKKTLEQTFEKQFFIKKTLVGSQRDVFEIYLDDRNVHKFGSRSEQRLSLFWLVVNEMRLYHEVLKKRPLVLLDDIFSELDIFNKNIIFKLIKNYQTVAATIEEEFVKTITSPKTVIGLE